jgi:hypothetical protein
MQPTNCCLLAIALGIKKHIDVLIFFLWGLRGASPPPPLPLPSVMPLVVPGSQKDHKKIGFL